MYEYESWTIKKDEHWRIDAFELWCWRRLLLSPLDCKEIHPVHPKRNQSWIFIGRIDAEAETPTLTTWCKELILWKRAWYWERLKAGGEGDDRMRWLEVSPTQWTWVWGGCGSWWWTGKPGILKSMGSQRVRHNWATKLNNQGAECGSLPRTTLTHDNNIPGVGEAQTHKPDKVLYQLQISVQSR